MTSDEHTWNLALHYHLCPKCGFIIECREPWQYRLGSWVVDLECSHCKYQFTETKKRKPTFGPLIGAPQPPEMNWE